MGYTLLGHLVWKAAKWYLARRYARTRVTKPVLGVAATATVGAALVVLQRRR